MKRRSFIKNAAFVSAPLLLPGVFKSFQNPDLIISKRKLVLIHLNGGNDGYNTIVPYTDPAYYNHRPTIAIPADKVIKLNNNFGFNPVLKSLKPHFDAGNMLIFNNVGCIGLDHSHYTSCKIWETGLPESPDSDSWIDRCENDKKAAQNFTIETTSDDFAAGLKDIAAQINTDQANSCYRISLDGFDTHQFQKYKHDSLLETYAQGLDTFLADLKASGKLDDTLIVTWSEFGRQLKENNKRGTEHGQANSLLIYGSQLKEKGIWEGSNHQTQFIDFRNIYATVLERWFDMPHATILNSKFEVMNWI